MAKPPTVRGILSFREEGRPNKKKKKGMDRSGVDFSEFFRVEFLSF
jgi:hypothetical protein